jgi:hypothetical protein
LIPRVDTVLQYLIDEIHEAVFAQVGIADLQLFFENGFEFLRRMVLDKRGSWAATFDFQAMACVLS